MRELGLEPLQLVALTGRGTEKDKGQAREAGFDLHVQGYGTVPRAAPIPRLIKSKAPEDERGRLAAPLRPPRRRRSLDPYALRIRSSSKRLRSDLSRLRLSRPRARPTRRPDQTLGFQSVDATLGRGEEVLREVR
jgi:hypothetical protein